MTQSSDKNMTTPLFKTYESGNTFGECIFGEYNCQAIPNFCVDMLSADYWQKNNAVTGTAQGRGTTWFVQYTNELKESHWVLRHYYRGGLIGKIIKDHYFFTRKSKTRAACEFELLKQMAVLNLPTPKPIAYRVKQHGLVYQADLLSSRIENAQDLVGLLTSTKKEAVISEESWGVIGATIKRFHTHGIYHHDLNAHNILFDANGLVYLIDFDRGEFRNKHQKEWQQSNMMRLKRSFMKEKQRIAEFQWTMKHWDMLMAGYNQ
jgi:3-deoxy-D-manno-octulosonic acid kinase